jgi:hypothetical protein
VPFDGDTYDRQLDGVRLGKQLNAVVSLMKDEKWRTLREIAYQLDQPEASVSARLRDVRKEKFLPNYTMESQRRTKGTWEYRIVKKRWLLF